MGWEEDDDDWGCEPNDLESRRGDTLVFQFTVYQPPPASSAPQDLTGWWVGFIAKHAFADPDSLAAATATTLTSFPNLVTFPNGPRAGLVQVAVGPLSTLTFADGPTKLQYAVKVIDTSGNGTTVREGRWRVLPGAWRATTPV